MVCSENVLFLYTLYFERILCLGEITVQQLNVTNISISVTAAQTPETSQPCHLVAPLMTSVV